MKDEKEETQKSLLKELCGADAELYALLSFYLYANPLAAISSKSLDVLIEEAEASGNFRPALDKAIFESAQTPSERERYIGIIRDITSKAIHATEQAKQQREQEGSVERAASLGTRIKEQKQINERAGDILDIAGTFYSEKLLQHEEDGRRETRQQARREEDVQETQIAKLEEEERGARRKSWRGVSRKERREAKKRDKAERLAAEERKQAREGVRKGVEEEERNIGQDEKTQRDARRQERRRD